MRLEIDSASDFLVQLIKLNNSHVGCKQLELFRNNLVGLLRRRYSQHWFPDFPNKGSGYRCIRINGKIDPIIGEAGVQSGFSSPILRSLFPSELTMWIDPKEVSYRIGENGSICVLYEEKDGNAILSESFSGSPTGIRSPIQPSREPNTCKGSFRNGSYFYLDPRAAVPMESCAAYVSWADCHNHFWRDF